MIPKLADLVEWLVVKRLTPEQKEIIWNKIPPYGQSILQKLLSPGEQYTMRRVERAKRCLHELGFTDRPLMELQEMLEDKSQPFQKRTAAWELALWEANKYTPASAWRCLSLLPVVTKGEKDSVRLIRATVLKAECHDILADRAGGFKAVKKQLTMSPHADLYLAAANLEDQLDKRLVWINKALALYELAPVT